MRGVAPPFSKAAPFRFSIHPWILSPAHAAGNRKKAR